MKNILLLTCVFCTQLSAMGNPNENQKVIIKAEELSAETQKKLENLADSLKQIDEPQPQVRPGIDVQQLTETPSFELEDEHNFINDPSAPSNMPHLTQHDISHVDNFIHDTENNNEEDLMEEESNVKIPMQQIVIDLTAEDLEELKERKII